MDLQPDLAVFSRSYSEARDKFLAAAAAAGARMDSHPHPLRGPAGEALATDCAWLGPEDASRVLVVLSATHGVEGLAGSGPQVHWLRRPDALPSGTAVLLVHAVNPHGFAWLRRVTEENVDLNRNWVDFGQPLPENPGYAELHPHCVPDRLDAPALAAAQEAIDAWRERHGEAALRAARSSGQYSHPDGLFYGGREPTWARRTSEAILARRLARARTVAIVDLHTGLGPYGYGEPICNHAPGGERVARARRWWGDSVTEPLRGTSSSQPKWGLTEFGYERALAHAQIAFVALEFGTYHQTRGTAVLRDDAWLWRHGDPRSPQAAPIREALRDHFYPPFADWQEMVLFRTRQVLRQALQGLEQEGAP
jgi:hypothetical protein